MSTILHFTDDATDQQKSRHKSLLKIFSAHLPHFHSPPPMAKHMRTKTSTFFADIFVFLSGVTFTLFVYWVMCSLTNPNLNPTPTSTSTLSATTNSVKETGYDPPDPTFYDDQNVGYTINNPIRNWDDKRREWLKHHPSFIAGVQDRILVVTGSQSTPCRNPVGDHILLRFFKNKVDYCRIHGHDIFYNNVLFQSKMHTYWAKIPTIRAAMVAHPEAEWFWWLDSDAAFTDMDFKLPLHRYKDHNLVVHGWPELIYGAKSWTSLNAGVFLIRNCQWSLDFMEVWAGMGPQSPNYDKWGQILRSTFADKVVPESDDQSGLVYLLLTEKDTWGSKIYVESEYYFEGYWMEITGTLDNITDRYKETEKKGVRMLRRRHAEKVREGYSALREQYLKEVGYEKGSGRRPFVTHFTGCQPCSGDHNQLYSGKNCWYAMEKALNFADNQVLRNFGFVHLDLLDSSSVTPLPFDFPA
ncbi:hypothetical protein LguiA_017674 [Lonicera macranthoides]